MEAAKAVKEAAKELIDGAEPDRNKTLERLQTFSSLTSYVDRKDREREENYLSQTILKNLPPDYVNRGGNGTVYMVR